MCMRCSGTERGAIRIRINGTDGDAQRSEAGERNEMASEMSYATNM